MEEGSIAIIHPVCAPPEQTDMHLQSKSEWEELLKLSTMRLPLAVRFDFDANLVLGWTCFGRKRRFGQTS